MISAIDEKSFGKLGLLLVLQLMAGYCLSCGCFLLGIPLGGWQFWLSVMLVVGMGFRQSRALGWLTVGANALVFLLTLYTFTYVHCDASICHLPMSHFLADGWNPVRESSAEVIRQYYALHGMPNVREFDIIHVMVDPKFTQILAAQYQSAFGLFSAAGYPLWCLFFALIVTGYRFARAMWGISGWAAAAFAIAICSNPFILDLSFRGLVDFVTYAAVIGAAMTLMIWHKERRKEDLLLFFMAVSIALVSKFTGLFNALLLLVFAGVFARKDVSMRRAFLFFGASLTIVLILPYWTAAYWHGSPFYPAHTFRAGVPLPDLTDDFIPINEDGMRMGFLARTTYAWISEKLAVWGCGVWYSNPGFSPEWRYFTIIKGFGGAFPFLLWGAVLASFLVRRRRVSWIIWLLFFTSFAVPLKYIGFPRYVAHMYAAIILALFNFVCAAPERLRKAANVLMLAAGVGFLWYDSLLFWDQVRDEGIRQRNMSRVLESETPYQLPPKGARIQYVANCYLSSKGGRLSEGPSERVLTSEWSLFPEGRGFVPRDEHYFWGPCDRLPSPLWQHPTHVGHHPPGSGSFGSSFLPPDPPQQDNGS